MIDYFRILKFSIYGFVAVCFLFVAFDVRANTTTTTTVAHYASLLSASSNCQVQSGINCNTVSADGGGSFVYFLCGIDFNGGWSHHATRTVPDVCPSHLDQYHEGRFTFTFDGGCSHLPDATLNTSTNECELPLEPTCEAGDFGSCAVECSASDWGGAGFVGHGQTCAGQFDIGGDSGLITYETSDYGCVSGSSVVQCDATGFNNGNTGSGVNGGNLPADQLTEFCESVFWDHSLCLDFSPHPDPVCENGALSTDGSCSDDVLNGFEWQDNTCAVGESPFFDVANGSFICVSQQTAQAPNNPPNPSFVGGTVQGGGGGDDDFDDSGIIEALESVDDSIDDVRDSVEDGNDLLEEIRDNTAKGTASGGSSCSAAPVCDGDPIQCAQLNQIWKLRCEDDAADFSGLCSSPFQCEGNAFECAREQAAYNQVCPTYEDNPDDARNNAYDTAVIDLAASMGSLGISADNVGDMTAKRTADGFELESEVDLEELVDGLDDYTAVAGECPADISLELGQFGSLVIPISDWCGILYFLGVLVRISATYAATRMIYLALVGV